MDFDALADIATWYGLVSHKRKWDRRMERKYVLIIARTAEDAREIFLSIRRDSTVERDVAAPCYTLVTSTLYLQVIHVDTPPGCGQAQDLILAPPEVDRRNFMAMLI